MARFVTDSQIHGYSIVKDILPVFYLSAKNLSLLYFFSFLLFSVSSSAQKRTNKQAQYEFEAANRTLQFDSEQALKRFYEILKLDSAFAPAYMRIGQLLDRDLTQKDKAIFYYEKAVTFDSTAIAFKNIYEILGKYYLASGNYSKATYFFRAYLKFPGAHFAQRKNIERYLSQCLYAQRILALNQGAATLSHSPLPAPLNSFLFQSYPVLTADLKTLAFTVFRGNEDLFIAQKDANGWTVPGSISPKVNTDKNEGTCSISADGTTLVFTGCHQKDGYGSCDLYISRKIGQTWQSPRNLGSIINTQNWESQPSLSTDGRTLYFSSDRPKGVGGKDIWVSQLDTSGEWTNPSNLGETINTVFDEISPFIHSNNETLFFASDGREGMGGFDLYISKLESEKEDWTIPINLGYPINDFADQQGFFIAPDCQQAFYSYKFKVSDQGDGMDSNSLICQLKLPDTLTALCPKAFFLKGKVIEAQTHKPLRATLTLLKQNIAGTNSTVHATNDSTGEFMIVFPNKPETVFFVESNGYYPKSLSVDSLKIVENQEIVVELLRFDSSQSEILKNVLFLSGSAELEATSGMELDRLVYFLQKNHSVKLIIEGHTDDLGNSKQNENLSLSRAQQVVKYLIEAGVAPERLKAAGYGYRKPLVQNKSEETRRLNRRVTWRRIE
ncbi:OmpA family protein [Runella sp.]|uniref:OmpA family protein n=1 Tax=Runella sp. TaxID=1960881 RepID=UPI003D1137F9